MVSKLQTVPASMVFLWNLTDKSKVIFLRPDQDYLVEQIQAVRRRRSPTALNPFCASQVAVLGVRTSAEYAFSTIVDRYLYRLQRPTLSESAKRQFLVYS